jgi:hypothetical protein
VTGGRNNTASGSTSIDPNSGAFTSVTGGGYNAASGYGAAVTGGALLTASATYGRA